MTLNKKEKIKSTIFNKLEFIEADLTYDEGLKPLFSEEKFYIVVNLTAQAEVTYSPMNLNAYIDSNILRFANILEACRNANVKHLVYAGSSSVYGLNKTMSFSVHYNVDNPISLYAASKKSNELMAHTYRITCTIFQ